MKKEYASSNRKDKTRQRVRKFVCVCAFVTDLLVSSSLCFIGALYLNNLCWPHLSISANIWFRLGHVVQRQITQVFFRFCVFFNNRLIPGTQTEIYRVTEACAREQMDLFVFCVCCRKDLTVKWPLKLCKTFFRKQET